MYHNKKGFTLIEIIVVLLIIGCLLAISIASFTGYLKKADKIKILANAKNYMQAVQTIAVEEYGAGNAYSPGADLQVTYEAITNNRPRPEDIEEKDRIREIYDLLEVGTIGRKFEAISLLEQGVITIVRYKDFKTDLVYEWTKNSNEWQQLHSDKPTGEWQWAGEILPDDIKGRGVWWNGYEPD